MRKKVENITTKLSNKQKNLVHEVVQNLVEKGGKPKGAMLRDAWYSKAMQKNPQKVFENKKILQALEALGIDDDFLALKRKQHLDARKIEYKNLYIKWENYEKRMQKFDEEILDELQEDFPGARLIRCLPWLVGDQQYLRAKFSYPMYDLQHKALDSIHKIRGDFAPMQVEHSGRLSLADLFSDDNDNE